MVLNDDSDTEEWFCLIAEKNTTDLSNVWFANYGHVKCVKGDPVSYIYVSCSDEVWIYI